MSENLPGGRVDLGDLTAAAISGVNRAIAARSSGTRQPFDFPIWVGFIFNPDWGSPPWNPGQPGPSGPILLTTRDHTLLVEAAFRHPLPLLKALGARRDATAAFTPDEVLRALGKVTTDSGVRDAVERTIQAREAAQLDRSVLDRSAQAQIKKLMGRISEAGSIDAKIEVLRAELSSTPEHEGYSVGVRTAIDILSDGKATIYNADFLTGVFGGDEGGTAIAKGAGQEIANADVHGAVSGGVAGGITGLLIPTPAAPVTGPALAAVGALAGGIGGSLGKAASKLFDWLF